MALDELTRLTAALHALLAETDTDPNPIAAYASATALSAAVRELLNAAARSRGAALTRMRCTGDESLAAIAAATRLSKSRAAQLIRIGAA